MPYCLYLRKSRSDLEAEGFGEGETLARHEKRLLETAKRQRLPITKTYREIVSGETIASRPMMQQLLSEVEQGVWQGVLVTEIERLARGDTIDQGIVAQAFKFSNTKIITPTKTYDPLNEFDEEYFEFGLFMSRREYKTINRRLQSGRRASAKEGKFVGSIAPYGYKRVKLPNEKGYSLEIVPEDAAIVKLIFSLYTNGAFDEDGTSKRMGVQAIAQKLNDSGVPAIRHAYWQKETIMSILSNPTYAGKIRWGYRRHTKKIVNGKTLISRPISFDENCIVAKGRHSAIIDESIFQLAQYYRAQMPPVPVGYKKEIKNPLAGLILCGKCGRRMVYRQGTGKKVPYLVCNAKVCNNVSSPFHLVEHTLICVLKEWFKEHTLPFERVSGSSASHIESIKSVANKLRADLTKLSAQLNRAHDAFEQGIYSANQFAERSQHIKQRIAQIQFELSKIEALHEKEGIQTNRVKDQIPNVTLLSDAFDKLTTPKAKNDLLKQVLEKAVYIKEKSALCRGVSPDDFELTLYPRIPKEAIHTEGN